MQPKLFHISTSADSGTLLSAPVLMVPTVTSRRGSHVYEINTPGCGILDCPSLAWAASLQVRPKLRRSEESPRAGPRLPSADGQLSGLQVASDLCMVWVLSSTSCPENPCSVTVHVFPIHPVLIASESLKACKTNLNLKWSPWLPVKLVYVLVTHIPWIYMVYVMYIPGIFGT
jgi:hypothetical protein